MRNLVIGLVLLIVAANPAACGGGNSSSLQRQTTGTPPELVSAADAMSASAERFQTEVQSFTGKMEIFESVAGKSIDLNGDMRYKTPNQVYMTLDGFVGLGSIEVLLVGTDYYFGFQGKWAHTNLASIPG